MPSLAKAERNCDKSTAFIPLLIKGGWLIFSGINYFPVQLGVGSDPFLGYALVGIGAAVYSPAKYGILGEQI